MYKHGGDEERERGGGELLILKPREEKTRGVSEKMSSQVRLRLLPRARCMFDEPVQVKVAGLRSRQVVTVRARSTDEKGVVFSSSATYRADGGGAIDLERDPSLSGSYTGVEPMGLLWSMRPDSLHKRFQRYKSLNPHVVKFSVHEEEEEEGRMLAEATNERLLIGDGVSRHTVKEGNIRGVLFTPPGRGPFPAVLDLYILGGGLSEKRASLLASRGFVVLTVVAFGYDDMPKKIKEVHLDYFEEAIQFLKKQDTVGSKGVGVISLSKTADLALSMASYLPGVEATVWINGCSANTFFPLYYKKRQILPALMLDPSKMILTESGAANVKNVLQNPLAEENKATLVPVEHAEGRFLFVAAEDDLNWDSKAHMDMMVERLQRHGKDNFESVCYPGAGHYLEPPYGPYCPSSFHWVAGRQVLWGGEPRSHAAAEVHMWNKIQEFFRTQLSCDATQTKAKL
ncbi:acyl-coenzyme A thioesterase 1-like isoform X1 [Cebidichthys violaceus]|uniref:acyl-coenzyme A thioesterase 1-like isoform X1 n=2 Tax=Cebidichthys violaceus TaxID=271503 RepID=UPI0035CB0B79